MKKAIVTGHSRGLGEALANELRAAGFEVLGISRSSGVTVDLASPQAVTSWLASGKLAEFLADASDIVLLNNAGMIEPVAEVGAQDTQETISAVNLNVTAPLLLSDAVLRARAPETPVRIAHISSGAGRRGYPGWSVYCATKAALDLHAQALASEQQPGVRVASIAPGVVDTNMQGTIRDAAGFPLRDQFVAMHQAGQLTSPQEAARQVLAILNSSSFGERVVTDVRG